MSHSEQQETFNLTYRNVFFTCLAAYSYSSWLSMVLVDWLPFAKAENVYFAVFLSFLFFIFYVILVSAIVSRRWFWIINSSGILLLASYWLLRKWGSS
ncbi:hypothetical protein [Acinetobacter sp. A47]|uniref:hypothetical protein n=1 Tax=Acinetobacter sp. A47 TaxID=1561217 RepID=UPI00056EB0E3|nr:hypothetical protein [Acinetobacter sp. A47]